MTNRPSIPIGLERVVKIEAGHRCAIPTCRCTTVEIAHIVPWNEIKEHKFDNLIALCPNCHALYDRDKKIDQKSMMIYKANLGLLNSRYAEFERRVLQIFCDDSDKETILILHRDYASLPCLTVCLQDTSKTLTEVATYELEFEEASVEIISDDHQNNL